MKISLNWLREFIPFDFSPVDLAEKLTMAGLEVEEISRKGPPFTGVVIGDVVKAEKHPNADKLTVCVVDVGENERLNIVCGASNVAAGQRVPVAKVGAVLGEDFKIKPVKLRGVKSEGMICSERELGISDSHEGILVLDPSKYAIGTEFKIDDTEPDVVLDIAVTPNRPDCLSHIGIAREVSVITDGSLRVPDDSVQESDTKKADSLIEIKIEDAKACPRYSARLVEAVEIKESPDWIKQRLESLGMRPINNAVDVTNLVLLETGQPLHAFDYDLIAGQKIIVRLADQNEKFTTLDDQSHTLTKEDLLICDGEKGVALAGVMGGQNSEVSADTRNVLLESAYFDPQSIRKTAKRVGLSTEASQRFERGCDPNNTIFAVNRAAKLLAELSGGRVAGGVVDENPGNIQPWIVSLRPERIDHVLGVHVPVEQVLIILNGLGLETNSTTKFSIQVTVPTFRPDLKKEIDLIEEVVRHYGYDKIEPRMINKMPLLHEVDPYYQFVESLRDFFAGRGFQEIISRSMVPEQFSALNWQKRDSVAVQNPLSPDTAFLRTSLIPGFLESIVYNRNRSQNNLRFFEIGRIFFKQDSPQPGEIEMLSGVMTGGDRQNSFWGEEAQPSHFFHLKGALEALFDRFSISDIDFFDEGGSIGINAGKIRIGFLKEIETDFLEKWDIPDTVIVFEIELEKLAELRSVQKMYSPISRFPAVKRDLAVMLDESILTNDVTKVIRIAGDSLLNSVDLFDVYRGEIIPEGKKSLAFSLTFSSLDRTLQDKDIDPVFNKIVQALESKLAAALRT